MRRNSDKVLGRPPTIMQESERTFICRYPGCGEQITTRHRGQKYCPEHGRIRKQETRTARARRKQPWLGDVL